MVTRQELLLRNFTAKNKDFLKVLQHFENALVSHYSNAAVSTNETFNIEAISKELVIEYANNLDQLQIILDDICTYYGRMGFIVHIATIKAGNNRLLAPLIIPTSISL